MNSSFDTVDEVDMTSKFEFKRISDGIKATEAFSSDLTHAVHLFSISNTYGLACWVSSTRNEILVQKLSFIQTTLIEKKEFLENTTRIALSISNIQFLFFLADEQFLLVASNVELLLLDASKLLSGKAHIHASFSFPHNEIDLITTSPNPKLHTIAILTSEKQLFTYNFTTNALTKLSDFAFATTWSLSDDQLFAIVNKEVICFDPNNQSIIKKYSFPNDENIHGHQVVALFTIDGNSLLLAFSLENEITIATLNLEDSSYKISSSVLYPILDDQKKPRVYFHCLIGLTSKLMGFIAASTSTDVLVFGGTPQDFLPWYLDEAARIIIPSIDMKDSIPIGMAVDLTSQTSLPPLKPDIDDTPIAPAPIFYILNDRGTLVGWHCLDIDAIHQRVSFPSMVQPQDFTASPKLSSVSSTLPPTSTPLSISSSFTPSNEKPSPVSSPTVIPPAPIQPSVLTPSSGVSAPLLPPPSPKQSSVFTTPSPLSTLSKSSSPASLSLSPVPSSVLSPLSQPQQSTLSSLHEKEDKNEKQTQASKEEEEEDDEDESFDLFIPPLRAVTSHSLSAFKKLRSNCLALANEVKDHAYAMSEAQGLSQELNSIEHKVDQWQTQLFLFLQHVIKLNQRMEQAHTKSQALKEWMEKLKQGERLDTTSHVLFGGLGPEQKESQDKLLASRTKLVGLMKKVETLLFQAFHSSEEDQQYTTLDSLYQALKNTEAAVVQRKLAVEQLTTLFHQCHVKEKLNLTASTSTTSPRTQPSSPLASSSSSSILRSTTILPSFPILTPPEVSFSHPPPLHSRLKSKFLIPSSQSIPILKAKNPTWECTSCHSKNPLLSDACIKCSQLHPVTLDLRTLFAPTSSLKSLSSNPSISMTSVTTQSKSRHLHTSSSFSSTKQEEQWICTGCKQKSPLSSTNCISCGKWNLSKSLLNSFFVPKPTTTTTTTTTTSSSSSSSSSPSLSTSSSAVSKSTIPSSEKLPSFSLKPSTSTSSSSASTFLNTSTSPSTFAVPSFSIPKPTTTKSSSLETPPLKALDKSTLAPSSSSTSSTIFGMAASPTLAKFPKQSDPTATPLSNPSTTAPPKSFALSSSLSFTPQKAVDSSVTSDSSKGSFTFTSSPLVNVTNGTKPSTTESTSSKVFELSAASSKPSTSNSALSFSSSSSTNVLAGNEKPKVVEEKKTVTFSPSLTTSSNSSSLASPTSSPVPSFTHGFGSTSSSPLKPPSTSILSTKAPGSPSDTIVTFKTMTLPFGSNLSSSEPKPSSNLTDSTSTTLNTTTDQTPSNSLSNTTQENKSTSSSLTSSNAANPTQPSSTFNFTQSSASSSLASVTNASNTASTTSTFPTTTTSSVFGSTGSTFSSTTFGASAASNSTFGSTSSFSLPTTTSSATSSFSSFSASSSQASATVPAFATPSSSLPTFTVPSTTTPSSMNTTFGQPSSFQTSFLPFGSSMTPSSMGSTVAFGQTSSFGAGTGPQATFGAPSNFATSAPAMSSGFPTSSFPPTTSITGTFQASSSSSFSSAAPTSFASLANSITPSTNVFGSTNPTASSSSSSSSSFSSKPTFSDPAFSQFRA